jgi:hypothetical protein
MATMTWQPESRSDSNSAWWPGPDVAKVMKRMEMTLAPDLVSPRRITLEKRLNERARIEFSAVRINPPGDRAKRTPPPRRG